jgi:anti-sigma factor RsiW
MTTRSTMEMTERRAVSELLPWYAAGTLSAADTARVEAALAADETLRDELDIVREDQDATFALAEASPRPSPRVLDDLMKRVEAEPAKFGHVAARARAGFADWLGEKLALLSPRTLAYAAGAAALALVIQAGVIGSSFISGPTQFQTASHSPAPAAPRAEGTYILIGFAADATAGDMARLLEQVKGSIVEGPRPGGFYRVRIGEGAMSPADLDRVVGTLRGQTSLVRFVGPAS